jgi:hypothetical protein
MMRKLTGPIIVIVLILTMVGSAGADVPAPGGPFKSSFNLQNMETSAITCSYEFKAANGSTAYTSGTSPLIDPGDALYVFLPDLTMSDGQYTAIVSCTGKVGAVSTYSDSERRASYNGIQEPGAVWYVPGLYDDYYDLYSTVIVQNTSSSVVDISLEIKQGTTVVKTQSVTGVPAYGYATFEQEGLTELIADNYYSGKLTATGGDVAPVVSLYGKNTKDKEMYSYNPRKSGGLTYYAPVLVNNYYGYYSAIVIQNMGTETTHVDVVFHTTSGDVNVNFDLTAGASITGYIPDVAGLPSGSGPQGIFNATVTSTGTGGHAAQNLNVFVNQNTDYRRAASYVAFQGTSTSSYIPLALSDYLDYNSSVTCAFTSGLHPSTRSWRRDKLTERLDGHSQGNINWSIHLRWNQ